MELADHAGMADNTTGNEELRRRVRQLRRGRQQRSPSAEIELCAATAESGPSGEQPMIYV